MKLRALDVTKQAIQAGCTLAGGFLAATGGALGFVDGPDEAKRSELIGWLARLLLESRTYHRSMLAPGIMAVTTERGQRFVIFTGARSSEEDAMGQVIMTGWEYALATSGGEPLEVEVMEPEPTPSLRVVQ